MRKYNQKYIKSRNQGQILKLLKENGPKSRVQISKEIGIVRSTVSEITNEMVELNIIYEGKKVTGNLGKRPTLLYFNKDFYYFIATVIRPEGVHSALCNLNGDIIKEKEVKYPEHINAKKIISLGMENIDNIIMSNIDPSKNRLISLGSPETFNVRTGLIKWAPYVKDWVGVDLRSIFKEKYGVHVIVKDHVKLETLGEHWKSFSNVSNMVYIIVTRGIGAGAIIDGKIREGKNGYLGEIAFLPVGENVNYNELLTKDKNLGYFESECDIKKIESVVKRHCKDKNVKKNIRSFDDVAVLYKEKEEVKEIINKSILKTLALGIATTIIVLDPEIIVLNGEIMKFGEEFLSLLKKEVHYIIPYKRQILFSRLGDKAGIYGAIRNGLDYIEKYIFESPNLFYELG
jgi:predicted NBD/HSP70 family sugar kinase